MVDHAYMNNTCWTLKTLHLTLSPVVELIFLNLRVYKLKTKLHKLLYHLAYQVIFQNNDYNCLLLFLPFLSPIFLLVF